MRLKQLILGLLAVGCLICFVLSCHRKVKAGYARQDLPIEIQGGNPILVTLSSSGAGWNDVGIQCPTEVWDTLANGKEEPLKIRFVSTNTFVTRITNIYPDGSPFYGQLVSQITNFHYLFSISNSHEANVALEIAFPNAPAGKTKAAIVVGMNIDDTLSEYGP